MYSRLLVPIDGNAPAQAALQVACVLADHHRAKLVLLCVTDPAQAADMVSVGFVEGVIRPESYQTFARELPAAPVSAPMTAGIRESYVRRFAAEIAEDVVRQGTAFAEAQQVPEVLALVRSGAPADAILDVAHTQGADLIVIGSAGRTGLNALFHPSVAEAVRRRATAPVLVLFPGEANP